MTLTDIFLIGVGLSMDAFAVSMSQGLKMHQLTWQRIILIGIMFGGFQALMPLMGFLLGSIVAPYISIGKWIASFVLFILGVKMIWDSFHETPEQDTKELSTIRDLLLLAVATSIDALATGVSFSLQNTVVWLGGGVSIFLAVALIGITTMCLSMLGVIGGHFFGVKYQKHAMILGGCILILIGIKILLEH